MVNKFTHLSIYILLTTFCSGLFALSPIASIDRNIVSIDDSIFLKIRINKSTGKSPELELLKDNFDVLSTSKSSQHSIVNGKSESWTEWSIILQARKTGQLVIPSINIGTEKTDPILVMVKPTPKHTMDNPQPVFLESEINKKQVYVQEENLLTVRIFHAIQLDNMNISEPDFIDTPYRKIAQHSFRRKIGNITYQVHEIIYSFYPQNSGQLITPQQTFTANEVNQRRSFFSLPGQGKNLRRKTQSHTIKVLEVPDSFSAGVWLPAKNFSISEKWSNDLSSLQTGQSITRTIELKSEGLLDSQLPQIRLEPVTGLKFYEDKPVTNIIDSDQGVVSSLLQSVAIIPNDAGIITLPEIRIPWWSTSENLMRVAVIPQVKLSISPATNNLTLNTVLPKPTSITAPKTTPQNNTWMYISFFAVFLWLITTFLLIREKQKTLTDMKPPSTNVTPDTITEKEAFNLLIEACNKNNANQVRSLSINWARAFWPDLTINNLKDFYRQANSLELAREIDELEEMLYKNDKPSSPTNWEGKSLIKILNNVRQQAKDNKKTAQSGLPDLYPAN